ncbi:MAG: hypothetical protein ACFFBI_10500 [Promethearchaeota archaeon]
MKKKRTISITDPSLKKVRNNLRSLWVTASSARKKAISGERLNLSIKSISEELSNKNAKRYKELHNDYWEIERPLRASILLCPTCFRSDKDMTYNPILKTWYCTECYAKLKKGYAEDGQADQFP